MTLLEKLQFFFTLYKFINIFNAVCLFTNHSEETYTYLSQSPEISTCMFQYHETLKDEWQKHYSR